ncbi:MAG TPA: CapA family protein [Acidimicrobiia bacterium]|nr:CapA family protein [Acidimicrobiia bacterium]
MPRSAFYLVILLGGALTGLAAFSLWGPADATGTTPTSLQTAGAAASSTTAAISTTTPTTIPSTTTQPPTTTVPEKGWLVIQGTGDVAVDPQYIPTLAREGWDHAWSGLDGLFLEDDLTVINLECVPSDIGTALDKDFVFRCPTETLPSIRDNGIDVANMGNNHSGDYGKEALVDGRDNLIATGIAAVGAGRNAAEAAEPALFERNGWSIAVVGFGGVAPSESWYATPDSPGMGNGDDTASMVEAVSAADAVADIVVVTVHWGMELDTTPRQDDIERAEAMIDAGADIVFGHHPHRMQPLEMVGGAAVFWSMGNFVWPHNSVASATTAVARAVVAPDGTVEACLIPAYIESHGHPVLTGEATCAPPS